MIISNAYLSDRKIDVCRKHYKLGQSDAFGTFGRVEDARGRTCHVCRAAADKARARMRGPIPAADVATSSPARVSFWRSADGQSSIDMRGATKAQALADLLGQCATTAQCDAILAGSFEVAE